MWRESVLPLALVDRQFVDFRGNYADGLHGLLQALLSRSVPVSTAANAVSEVSMAVTQVGQDRQSAKRLFKVLAVAAIVLLVGLAVAFRTPLSAQFGAAPGPAPKPTVPTATMVPSPSRRARVTVTFTQITVHDDADRFASGGSGWTSRSTARVGAGHRAVPRMSTVVRLTMSMRLSMSTWTRRRL